MISHKPSPNFQQTLNTRLDLPNKSRLYREIIYAIRIIFYSMATSSGNSSGSSKGEVQAAIVDQRKRKRMESNRESARRSRMKKQKHLNEVMSQLTELRKYNNQILTSINTTTQYLVNIDAENSILRAQMVELSHRLEYLNGIISYISNVSPSNNFFECDDNIFGPVDGFMNPLNNTMSYVNQPILASSDLFHY